LRPRHRLFAYLLELDPAQFWQVDRATIVNSRAIAHVVREDDRLLIALKSNNERIEVSRSFAHRFKSL
jgi:DNA-binding LytR/AlgR family response regulator